MKSLLIAAGMIAALFGAAPAMAAPVSTAAAIEAPPPGQDVRSDRRDRRVVTRTSRTTRSTNRGPGWNNGRTDRRYGWNQKRCQNVRRHHRWVRVCTRR
jgi:hypothetical protein